MNEERLIPLLLRTTHYIRRKHTEVLGPFGLTFQQFNVLRILLGAERLKEDSLPIMEISRRMVEPGVGITRLTSKLESLGYLTLFTDADDSRVRRCELTNKGRNLLEEVEMPVRVAVEQALSGIDRRVEQELTHALQLMLRNLT